MDHRVVTGLGRLILATILAVVGDRDVLSHQSFASYKLLQAFSFQQSCGLTHLWLACSSLAINAVLDWFLAFSSTA